MPRLRLSILIALVGLAATTPARAEDLRYPHLERLFEQRNPVTVIRPSRSEMGGGGARIIFRSHTPETRRSAHAAHPYRERAGASAVTPSPAAAPAVPKTFFVAVLGDAMALKLADGLAESLARERPQVEILRKGRDNSGVVREDFFDWRKAARDLAGGAEKIDYVVMMLGVNDRQPMRGADGATLETLSEGWRAAYAQRVEEMIAPFRAKTIPVVWVGLPIMRAERYGADVKIINTIARAAAERAGASFVETWERFADEAGAYDSDGPDVNGRVTRLRAGDGVYFTHAGALKLAHFVEGDIARLAGAPPVAAPAPAIAAPAPLAVDPSTAAAPALLDPAEVDVAAVIRRGAEAGPPREADLPGVALPDALPAPVFPTRPAAGPVASLTAPPRAPGGALAVAPAPTPAALTEPRPGRADDFVWPRRP
jgi:hypothetical protein